MPARIRKSGASPRSASAMKVSVKLIKEIWVWLEGAEKRGRTLEVGCIGFSARFEFSGLHKRDTGYFGEKDKENPEAGQATRCLLENEGPSGDSPTKGPTRRNNWDALSISTTRFRTPPPCEFDR